jgi:hypothetical protein
MSPEPSLCKRRGRHGGSAFDPDGGKGATTAIAWLEWQFRHDPQAARMFVEKDRGLCRDSEFSFEKKASIEPATTLT